MKRTDYAVVVLIILNYALEAALLTHVQGFDLPPLVTYVVAVALAPIGPVLAILPQLGVHVPALAASEPAVTEALPAAVTEAAPLHPAP